MRTSLFPSLTALCCTLLLGCGSEGPEWLAAEVPTKLALRGIYGLSAQDIYAVGDQGTLLHYDGSSWKALDSGGPGHLRGVWAASPNDVWVVGESGRILRGNASSGFKPIPDNTGADYTRVWGTGPSEVLLMSDSDTWRYDGTSLAFLTRKEGSYANYRVQVDSISGSSTLGVWVTVSGSLYRLNGTEFSRVDVGTEGSWELAHASTADEVWLFGSQDEVLHLQGGRWNRVESPIEETLFSSGGRRLRASWSNGPNDVWFVGDRGRILHYDGARLSLQVDGGGFAPVLHAVWGASGFDMWAVGDEGWALRRFVTQ